MSINRRGNEPGAAAMATFRPRGVAAWKRTPTTPLSMKVASERSTITFRAGGDDRVKLGWEGGHGGEVVLAVNATTDTPGRCSTTIWPISGTRPSDATADDCTPEHGRGAPRRFLSVYPVPSAGSDGRDVVRTKQTSDLANLHLRLPCEPTSVPRARERVREWCHQLLIRGDLVADVLLAVTEAAANAVCPSACVDFEIQGWTRHATLIVSVWDRGQGRGEPEPGAGLGTPIIRALADSVDIEDTQPGTRVTMRFPRRA
jgi:anti-sigma regulatory factor (Ser/Thr protein kinase)